MKICFIYPDFERHAEAHPELKRFVGADAYLGPPSLGIAAVAAATPDVHDVEFIDDRVTPFDPDLDADLFAISCFTPAATRAMEISSDLRSRGKKVVLGGIFPSMMPQEAAPHCDAVVIGEGEGVWPELLADLEGDALKPRYRAVGPLDISTITPPRVDLYLDAEQAGRAPDDYPLQISRGCPFSCDACVLPLQLGRTIRLHTEEYVLATARALAARGKLISLTEDTSVFGFSGARRFFRRLLKRFVELQRSGTGLRFSYVGITIPLLLNLEQSLLNLIQQTGMDRFYLVCGFDETTRAGFGRGDAEQLEKAARAIERCHDVGVDPYVSFMVGNPDDDEGVFDRILEFARRARVDLAEFVISTPYPGTPLWQRYSAEGRIIDRTWKHYNDANVVFRPHGMSAERLLEGYISLWREFYRGRDDDLDARPHSRRTIQF